MLPIQVALDRYFFMLLDTSAGREYIKTNWLVNNQRSLPMTKKEFFHAISNGKVDVLQILLDTLAELKVNYCIIGGLAVNAYAEPIVSLDLDIIVAVDKLEVLCESLEGQFKIEKFAHSLNLSSNESDLRIQIQTDPRYQEFIDRAVNKTVLGYPMRVASMEDVLQGKIWAYSDDQRRKSKRQKDLTDIVRLVEVYPSLKHHLPEALQELIG